MACRLAEKPGAIAQHYPQPHHINHLRGGLAVPCKGTPAMRSCAGGPPQIRTDKDMQAVVDCALPHQCIPHQRRHQHGGKTRQPCGHTDCRLRTTQFVQPRHSGSKPAPSGERSAQRHNYCTINAAIHTSLSGQHLLGHPDDRTRRPWSAASHLHISSSHDA